MKPLTPAEIAQKKKMDEDATKAREKMREIFANHPPVKKYKITGLNRLEGEIRKRQEPPGSR